MLFAFSVIAFAMMLGRGAMGFGGVLVMLRCLIVLVSSHWISPISVWVSVCLAQWQPGDVSGGSNPRIHCFAQWQPGDVSGGSNPRIQFTPGLSNFAQT